MSIEVWALGIIGAAMWVILMADWYRIAKLEKENSELRLRVASLEGEKNGR